jgi:uncharacterized protein (TIGR02271 family)
MRWDRNNIQEGMLVTSETGERIGKVIRCDGETFVVEKGTLFPKDYALRYDRITGTGSDGTLVYDLSEDLPMAERASVQTASREEEDRVRDAELRAEARAPEPLSRAEAAAGEKEVRIPLLGEELDVEKYSYESGHVRIHKGVRVEERRFTVPVRREEVVVEHVSTKDWQPAASVSATSADTAFQDQMLDIPLYEEDIRVGKHSVVREEVVVRTVARDVDLEGSASLRSEEAEIEDSRHPGYGLAGPARSDSSPTGYTAVGRH